MLIFWVVKRIFTSFSANIKNGSPLIITVRFSSLKAELWTLLARDSFLGSFLYQLECHLCTNLLQTRHFFRVLRLVFNFTYNFHEYTNCQANGNALSFCKCFLLELLLYNCKTIIFCIFNRFIHLSLCQQCIHSLHVRVSFLPFSSW